MCILSLHKRQIKCPLQLRVHPCHFLLFHFRSYQVMSYLRLKMCRSFAFEPSVNQTNLSLAVRQHLTLTHAKALHPEHLGATQKRVTNSDLKEQAEADKCWGAVCSLCTSSSLPSCLNKLHTCFLDFKGLNNPKRCLTPYWRLLRSCEETAKLF